MTSRESVHNEFEYFELTTGEMLHAINVDVFMTNVLHGDPTLFSFPSELPIAWFIDSCCILRYLIDELPIELRQLLPTVGNEELSIDDRWVLPIWC